MLLAQTEEAFP